MGLEPYRTGQPLTAERLNQLVRAALADVVGGDGITICRTGNQLVIGLARRDRGIMPAENGVELSDENPLDVGAAADPGTGEKASRDDHVHEGTTALTSYGAVLLSNVAIYPEATLFSYTLAAGTWIVSFTFTNYMGVGGSMAIVDDTTSTQLLLSNLGAGQAGMTIQVRVVLAAAHTIKFVAYNGPASEASAGETAWTAVKVA